MVSIVIVNWNSGPLLEHCVCSLREHAAGCEIIVVDNASRDSSLEFIGRAGSPLLLLRNDQNAGFATACNQGWHRGQGEKILFLNPDAESLAGGVEGLAQRLESEPVVWAVGGRLLDAAGAHQAGFNVRAFPSIGAVAAEMLLLEELWPRNPWTRRYRMTDWDYSSPGDVDQPAAACLMVRRAALESLGGFDERFRPAWFEDVDLCKRIRDAGGRIVFEPRARFLHHGAVSLRNLTREEFLRCYHANQIRYFEKHHGSAASARVRRLVVAGLYLRALLAAPAAPFRGRSAATPARAYWRVARDLAGAREARA
ncbi:MAG: glycosyltransferase family 2 protein [Acidobacteriia bacterium]|nr:glycosyltransferase family 2 protein [Terriglobia bacterium]